MAGVRPLLGDLPVAWWTFWLVAAAAIFGALAWIMIRLALRRDEAAEEGAAPRAPHTPPRKEPS